MEYNPQSRHPFEPSQEELLKEPEQPSQLSRRTFFKLMGTGLAVAFVFQDIFSLAGETSSTAVPVDQVGAWIHIGEDGIVTVYTGKVEVGQNIRTSLTQIVAEELRVPVRSIKVIMGDTDLVPYDAGTFGSRTTPQMGTQLRKAAATARQALLDMAGKNWNVDATSLKADQGIITHIRSGKKIGYGLLTKGQQLLLPVSENVQVTLPDDWKIVGKTIPKVDGRAFITGKHKFVSDIKVPGMLYGKILRAPAYQSKLVSADLSKAQALPGVIVVRDEDFIGVAAPDKLTAEKAIKLINVNWETSPQPSRGEIFEYLVQNTTGGQGGRNSNNSKGDAEQALASSTHKLSSTYNIHYIAHVPLEPRAAVAQWEDGKLTVWTGTQRPFGVQQELSQLFNMPKEKVRVIMPDTGSGYGGKHSGEAAIEAARLARAAQKPVKVVWTRQEEFIWAYFRPGGVIKVESGMNSEGDITAWTFNNYNSGPSGLNTQYKIASSQIAYHPSKTPLRQGSYRGLASTANVFARESHIADMARLVKMDQYEFRMRNLQDERLKAVLEKAATEFEWKRKTKRAGTGFGIACGFEKGGYVATCAEVQVSGDKVKVVRLTEAFECGAVINPLHLENQVLGAILQGLGGALFESVDFADGKILNANLSTYRVPKFSDTPKLKILLMDRKDLPSAGAGEAPIIGVAPAIRNAILDASGVALTTLPMLPDGVLATKRI